MSTTIINVTINDNIATAGPGAKIVCDNKSVYEVEFKFDSMWDDQPVKTARFIYNDHIVDEPITGNRAKIPRVIDATTLYVGVYADDIQTSTPATVECLPSILGRRGTPPPPSDDVYSKLIALINAKSGYPIVDVENQLPETEIIENVIYRLEKVVNGEALYSLHVRINGEWKEIIIDYEEFATKNDLKKLIQTAQINDEGNLVIILIDGTVLNLGRVKGADGKIGKDGVDGKSIADATINSSGQLVLTFSDSTVINVGKVVGAAGKDGTSVNIIGSYDSPNELPTTNNSKGDAYLIEGHLYIWDGLKWKDNGNIQGPAGKDGDTITSASLNTEGQLVLTLSNGTTLTVGKVVGANGKDGKDGKDGVGISNVTLNGNNLVITLTNGTVIDLGNVKGADGKDGEDGQDGTNGSHGADGKDGITPIFKIENGELFVSSDNSTSWSSLGNVKGADGKNGVDGAPGKDGNDAECKLSDDEANYIKKLYKDSQYVAFTGNLSMSPATTTYEIGASNSVTFSWSFNKIPTSLVFNNKNQELKQNGSISLTVTSNKQATLTYNLTAKYQDDDYDKTDTVNASKSISFYNKYFWGCASIPTTVDSAFIKSLSNSDWAKTKALSFAPTCPANQYIWYAYPKRLGGATMFMGGFEGGFEPVQTISVTNSFGFIEDYYVYRSTNAGVSLSVQAK